MTVLAVPLRNRARPASRPVPLHLESLVTPIYHLGTYMNPDEFGELKKGSAETLILAILEEGPRHGYDLAKRIEERSGGRLTFHVASLYTNLYRLERDALIVGRWVEKAGQRRRRFYRLTPAGRAELAARRRSWRDFVTAIENVVLKPA